MTEQQRDREDATLWGTFYPRGYIVGVVHDWHKAEAAAAKLREAGFAEGEIHTHSGQDVLAHHEELMKNRNVAERIASSVPSDESAAVDEYLAEARRGSCFVTVHAPEQAQVARARDVLRDEGVHAMRHYERSTITDL
jgi:hypothetical protein